MKRRFLAAIAAAALVAAVGVGGGLSVPTSHASTTVTVARVGGQDRYATAVALAKDAYPGIAPVVFLATGANFPDALSAGPAAAKLGGPLLLTAPDQLPSEVSTELQSLRPSKVEIVGGTAAVSAGVQTAVHQLLPSATVTRLAGADRYATARAVDSAVFGTASTAYVATGANYPDALSAAAAAGSGGHPVVLLNGAASTVDQSTVSELSELGVTSVVIAGGTAAVSSGIQTQLQTLLGPAHVTRLGGVDRYDTSGLIAAGTFSSATKAYLASGSGFPDALAASAVAGAAHAPLFTVQPGCVPMETLANIHALGVSQVTIVGGTAALTDAVAALNPCPASGATLLSATPTISGTPYVGSTLTASPGTWKPSPVTFTYQWLRGGAPIAGATASSYTLVGGDSGHSVSVSVTGFEVGYSAKMMASSAVAAAAGSTTGSIIGRVTSDGTALAGVTVTATASVPVDSTTAPSAEQATTAADGTYALQALTPGTWTVCFLPSSGDYLGQCYPNIPFGSSTAPTLVTVTAGATASAVSADLARASQISGTVTDSRGPVAGVYVTAVSGDTSVTATTSSDGSYTVEPLPAGSYSVCFTPATPQNSGVADQQQCWHNLAVGETPTPVTVTAGGTTTGIDAVLASYGAIHGTVTDAASFGTLAGVSVVATLASDPTQQFFALTGSDGTYQLDALASGSYDVCFYPALDDNSSHVGQCYDGEPLDGSTSHSVAVTTGAVTSAVNAALANGATISGRVQHGGLGLAGVDVQAVSGAAAQQDTTTAADGSYSLTGLDAGDYTVCFYPPAPVAVLGQCYDNEDASTGTPDTVSVTAGHNTTGINASLEPAGSISGTVRGPSGTLAGVDVEVTNSDTGATSYASTNSTGTFTVGGLVPADYTVCAYPTSASSASYLSACAADPTTVADGQSVTGPTLSLQTGATVSGRVTSTSSGAAIAGVEVDAYPVGSGTGASTTTAADGGYQFSALKPDDYVICFYPDSSYIAQCYSNQPADGSGSPPAITVTSASPVTGINAALDPEN